MIVIYSIFLAFTLLTICWWYFFVARKQMNIEFLRQNLFNLREELFDKAVANEINFESEAYGMLRTTLNGFIRYAEDLTLARMLITLISHNGNYIPTFAIQFEAAKSKLTSEQRSFVERVHKDTHMWVAVHLVKTSLVLRVYIEVLRFKEGVRSSIEVLVKPVLELPRLSSSWEKIDSEATLYGELIKA